MYYSAAIDSENGYAYFGQDTEGVDKEKDKEKKVAVPSGVFRINLSNFKMDGCLCFTPPTKEAVWAVRAAAIDNTHGYAYFGTYSPSNTYRTNDGKDSLLNRIIEVDLSNFTPTGKELQVSGGVTSLVIDKAGDYAFVGYERNPTHIDKVQLSNFTITDKLDLNNGEGYCHGAAADQANGFIYYGCNGGITKVVKVDMNNFSRVGGVSMGVNYEYIRSGVVDPVNGYAYFGSAEGSDVAGIQNQWIHNKIFKVAIGNGTPPLNVSRPLSFGPGEKQNHMVVDSARNLAYIANSNTLSSAAPSKVYRVDLSTMSIVGSPVTLSSGYRVTGGVIDPNGNYAYFGSYSGDYVFEIRKIRLSDFTEVSKVQLMESYKGYIGHPSIDSTCTYMYWTSDEKPGKVIKVKTNRSSDAPPARIGTVTLDPGEDQPANMVVDSTGTYGYVGTKTSPAHVAKIALGIGDVAPTRNSAIDLNESNCVYGSIDNANGYAYFGCYANPGVRVASTVAKVRLSNFARVNQGTHFLPIMFRFVAGTDTILSGGYGFYVGQDGQVVKVGGLTNGDNTLPSLASQIKAPGTTTGAERSIYLDAAHGFVYMIDEGDNPSKLYKLSVGKSAEQLILSDTLTLDTGDAGISSSVIDSTYGYAYFGTETKPGKVVKVDLSSFTKSGTLSLDPGEDHIGRAAVIDTVHGYAYFGTQTKPGKVIKLRLSDFTKVGILTLKPDSGEDWLTSATIDTTAGYAYFGTNTSPGRVIKVALNGDKLPTRVEAVTLDNPKQNNLISAAIDTSSPKSEEHYAYFGGITDPNPDKSTSIVIVKVALGSNYENPKRVASIIPRNTSGTYNANHPSYTAFIKSPIAYFGLSTNNGSVIAFDLSNFPTTGVSELGVTEKDWDFGYDKTPSYWSSLSSAYDSDTGYAYIGSFYVGGGDLDNLTTGGIVRYNVETKDKEGAIPLEFGESKPLTAVIDSTTKYAYFGLYNAYSPAIVKISLAPTRQYRLEYAVKSGNSCSALTDWKAVTSAGVHPIYGVWQVSKSEYIKNNDATTNVLDGLSDPVPDPDSKADFPFPHTDDFSFLDGKTMTMSATSAGVRMIKRMIKTKTSSKITSQFTEMEWNVKALKNATETDYCFRVTDAGVPLTTYTQYGEATISP